MSKESETQDKKNSTLSTPKPFQGAGVVLLGDAIEIYPDRPLPHLDVGPVRAYQAGARVGGGHYYALICERHLMPRHKAVEVYAGFSHSSMVQLVQHGRVYWPAAGQERYTFVYKPVPGKRLMADDVRDIAALRSDDVLEGLVTPMIEVLQRLRDKDFVHGSIRPSNIYVVGDENKLESVVLGDCLSLPASYAQPCIYETIQRAQVDPVGRGVGTHLDDMYAFGVTLGVMLRSEDPLRDKTDEEIVKEKILEGSYAALMGNSRVKGPLLELLRGLLHDDPVQRWSLDEVLLWVNGRRLTPKQGMKTPKAARPLIFGGQRYYRTSFLAMDLDSNPQETRRLLESGELKRWLERSLEDHETMRRVDMAVKASRENGSGPGYEERLVANVSKALDPGSPIRYRGLKLMGDGIGTALACAMSLKKDLRPFSELFNQNIPVQWITAGSSSGLDLSHMIPRFDHCKSYVKLARIGYGLEKCVYTLLPNLHCLSEKLIGYYVRSPEEMIFAFEDMCERGKAPMFFLDRHSIAFLSVKDPKAIDAYLYALESSEEAVKMLANLRCIANVQRRATMPALPNLGRVFDEMMIGVYERYHDNRTRERIQKKVKDFAAEGNLSKMIDFLDNPEVLKRDIGGFKVAMAEYAELADEYETLERRLEDKNKFGVNTAKAMAAMASSALATLAIICATIMFFSGKAGF